MSPADSAAPSADSSARPPAPPAASSRAPDSAAVQDRSFGARLFESRRWVHPPFLIAALVLGGASPPGMVAGAALLALYLGIRLWCCRFIRGAARVHARKAQERKVLVTGGPFGWVRNPLYVGNTLGLSGCCLLLGPGWLAGLAAAASLTWYHFVVRWEESVLVRLYPESYPDYRRAVPRFLPRPWARRAAPDADPREPYPWIKVLRRERGAIAITCAVVLLAVARRHLGG